MPRSIPSIDSDRIAHIVFSDDLVDVIEQAPRRMGNGAGIFVPISWLRRSEGHTIVAMLVKKHSPG